MRLPLRLACAVAAAMLLSSCWWVGPPFYKGDPADAGPLKPGLYDMETTTKPDQSGKAEVGHSVVRVLWRRNGSVELIDQGKPKDAITFIAVRLVGAAREFWIVQNDIGKPHNIKAYGLMEMRDGDVWMIPTIDCDETVDIVQAAGGTVSGGMDEASNVVEVDATGNETDLAAQPSEPGGRTMQTCSFGDKASLERALRAYVATDPPFPAYTRFKKIGD